MFINVNGREEEDDEEEGSKMKWKTVLNNSQFVS